MTVVLIHHVRATAHGRLEPVGVCAIDDDRERHFYPVEYEKYESRGWKALFHRPDTPASHWAVYKAETSRAARNLGRTAQPSLGAAPRW